jgi:hypothetical protein
MKRWTIPALAGAAIAASALYAWAQPTTQILSGSELVNIQLTSGQGATSTINALRGAWTSRIVSGVALGTTNQLAYPDQNILLTGSGVNGTFQLPNPEQNGGVISFSNSSGATTGTVIVQAPAGGNQSQTLNAAYSATIANFNTVVFIYVWTNPTTGTWYRVQ